MLKLKRKRTRTRTKHLRTLNTALLMVWDAIARQRVHRLIAHGPAVVDMRGRFVVKDCVACREWVELIDGLEKNPRGYKVQTMSGDGEITQREDGD